MKRRLLIAVLLIFSVAFLTCKKTNTKPVTKSPLDSLTGSVPANKSGVDNLLLSAYDLLDGVYIGQSGASWETGTDNWLYGSVEGGEAHKGGTPSDQTDSGPIETYTATSDNVFLDVKWKANLVGLARANAAIKELTLVKDGSVSTAEAAQVTAEARFLRGFYELELSKLWRNVPYMDESGTLSSNTGTIWDKIEADFTAAMNTLPTTQSNPGRPNKYAAEAFLAKTYMFDHKYTHAQPLLADLIASGVTTSGTKYSLGHYADNFNPSTKNGAEGVFVIQAKVHDNSNGMDGNAGDVLNFPVKGLTTCCGFFMPSFSFVNAFKTDAVTGLPLLDTYNNSDIANDEGITSDQPFTPTNVTLDSRLDWSVGRRGIPYLDWGIMPGMYWVRDQEGEGPYVPIKTSFYQAAEATTTEAYEGWASNQSTSNGYNVIRYADVLLWAAEVEIEVGSLQKAEDYVNMVRNRAADPSGWVHTYQDASNPMGGFTSTPAANYKVGLYGAAGGNPSTGFTVGGQTYARKAIYMERLLELGMEGHRFFDLQRWEGTFGGPAGNGFVATTINAYIAHEKSVANFSALVFNGAGFVAGKNELYPIPKSQTDKYSTLKQNPGY